MASILRSSKFVRYVAGFARNVVLNTPREFDGNLVNTTQCFCGAIPRSLSAQASLQNDQSLERSLKRLDQDVRRSGRISRRDIEEILEEIRNSRSATSSQSLLVIRCCGNLVPEELPEVRTKLVQEIWNTLNKLNIPLDISHYNALLRVYLENEHSFSPAEFLSELESKGIEPNRVTYQRLIGRYCQEGDIEGATKILEFMREKQFPVNENVFNALIIGHSQTGDMDSAEGIIGVMSQAGLEPSADTYTTLLCGYAKKGDIDTINKLLGECEQKEIYLLDKDYLDIAYSLALSGHVKHIPAILDKTKKNVGFNQDAVNTILRLINKRQEEAAYTVLKSMPRQTLADGNPAPSGGFFIKQLVKAKRPAETIIKYCQLFESEQLHERSLLLATEYSLQFAYEDLAYRLLDEVNKKGLPIRQHYFWPLIMSKANDPTGESIINVLINMQKFNINPNAETLREYVVPNLKGNSSQILSQLRRANISLGSSACNLAMSLLLKNNIEEAAVIVSRVPAYYFPEQLKKPLCVAFNKTKDVNSFITILRHIYENVDRRDLIKVDEVHSSLDKNEIVGSYLLELAKTQREFFNVAETVLSKIADQGLSISISTAERLQEILGDNMTNEISVLLTKLSSGELSPVPIVKKLPSYIPSSQMNIPQLERLIHNLEAKGQNTKTHKRQLFNLYCRYKEIDKLDTLLKDLESDGFEYTAGIYSHLIDAYAYHDKLEKTLPYLEKLKEIEPTYKLDKGKLIRVINMFINTDNFEKAIEFIKVVQKGEQKLDNNFAFNSQVWQLFNTLAIEGRTDDLNTLFNLLLEKEIIEVNNVILGPLIKVHIVNNDLDSALNKFEWCVNQYRSTPCKNELTCKLIQAEDAEKLQHLTDLSTSVHGEINSLYDLVFSFVECGRVRQARKILETPGLQSRPQRFNITCERYQQEGKIKPLEDLRTATKDLSHIDRSDLYYQLLLGYIKQEDVDKALGLWTQMQEEDLTPNDQFLHELGTFLQKRGVEVPFVVPNYQVQEAATETVSRTLLNNKKSDASLFRNCIKYDDLNGALQLKSKSTEEFSVTDVCLLIEKLTQANRLQEATALSLELLKKNKTPVYRILRFLLNKLANAGDVEAISKFENAVNPEIKKILSFDNRLCNANLVAGKAEEYLNKLEQDIENATAEQIEMLKEKFPRGGAIGILERYPEYLNKFESLAVKYVQKDIIGPINVLWSYYFINNNDEKAEAIWNKYLQGAQRIMFQRIVQSARENKNEDLILKLIKHLKTSKVTEGALGNAYSCFLDILVAKDKKDEVIDAFETAVKDISINYINRTAVLRVKEIYEKLGKPFNHKVPEKSHKNTATSSSDSEVQPKS